MAEYIVRRNFRHNGKAYLVGSKPLNIATLDEVMRMNLRAGVIEPFLKPAKRSHKKKVTEPVVTPETAPEGVNVPVSLVELEKPVVAPVEPPVAPVEVAPVVPTVPAKAKRGPKSGSKKVKEVK